METPLRKLTFHSPEALTDVKAIEDLEAQVISSVQKMFDENNISLKIKKEDDRCPDIFGMGTHFSVFYKNFHFLNGNIFSGYDDSGFVQDIRFYPIDTDDFVNGFDYHITSDLLHELHVEQYKAQMDITKRINCSFQKDDVKNSKFYSCRDYHKELDISGLDGEKKDYASMLNHNRHKILLNEKKLKECNFSYQPELIKTEPSVCWDMTFPNQEKIKKEFIHVVTSIVGEFGDIIEDYNIYRLTGKLYNNEELNL